MRKAVMLEDRELDTIQAALWMWAWLKSSRAPIPWQASELAGEHGAPMSGHETNALAARIDAGRIEHV